MGHFHQHPALVRALPLRDGLRPLRRGAPVLSSARRAPDTDFGGDRGRGPPVRGDVQGDADSDDCGGNSAHHRGSGADLGEPSVG